jgi:hypothetical protein
MTWAKLIAFSAEALLTFVIVIAATLSVHEAPAAYGWRGLVAVTASMTAGAIVVVLVVWSILYRLSTRAARDHDAVAPIEPRSLSLQQHTGDVQ